MPKITIISTNLSTNCMVRSVVLSEALSAAYTVEMVGTHFGGEAEWGPGLWPPIRGLGLDIKEVAGDLLPGYLPQIRTLLKLIDGDLIIACKPRFPSFGIALLKRAISGIPVILDVDDDELAMTEGGRGASLLHKLRDTSGFLFTRAVHPLHRLADGVFCVSHDFRRRYGGVIVPHGRDPAAFDPARYDRNRVRGRLGLADDALVIGFFGTPHPHKGIDLIAKAARRANDPRIRLVMIGTPDSGYGSEMRRQFGDMVSLLPPFPPAEAPSYLAAVDVVAIPQRNSRESMGQMPAKMTDAMAMGKVIVASAVSDIPSYLDGCGLLVPPDDEAALAESLAWVAANRAAAGELGRKARERFLGNLTHGAMLSAMKPEIERLLARQASARQRKSGKACGVQPRESRPQ